MLNDRIRAARIAATGVRGRYKGYLKGKCPPMGTDAALFWQAAMMEVNPYKVGMGHMLFMSADDAAFSKDCTAFVLEMHTVNRRTLDLDARELKQMGAW